MQNQNFRISDEMRDFIFCLLEKSKPRLPDDRIKYFVFEVDREIRYWLKGLPLNGIGDGSSSATALCKISKASYDLMAGLRLLANEAPGSHQALMSHLLGGSDRGFDQRDLVKLDSDIEMLLHEINAFSNERKSGAGKRADQHAAEDLAYRLAGCYLRAFSKLPSLNQGGIYRRFVDEVVSNVIPSTHQVKIGRNIQQMAANRLSLFINE